MKLIVSGASGLVGQELLPHLKQAGHQITSLVRRPPQSGEVRWYPDQNLLQPSILESPDGFIHLGGDNIADGRWTAAKKRRIRDSRVQSTRLLAETMTKLEPRPQVFVCASAIGYYGDQGGELLSENSSSGNDFLADVCREWEAATQPARDAGIRVVNLRIGVVLSRHGGALQKMLTPFKMGLGGIVGSGQQYWSCLSRSELVHIIGFVLDHNPLSGPVNAVSVAVTNREFTKALGRVLGRPTLLPMPAFAAKLVFGELGEALMLSSTRVVPEKLQQAGYEFRDQGIEAAISSALA